MTDEERDRLANLYSAYLAERTNFCRATPPAPYRWEGLPETMTAGWLPYAEMLKDHSRDLANTVNELTGVVPRLRAWAKVTKGLSPEETMEANIEFVGPLATTALGLPYALRSRFAFSAAHLCHQANRVVLPNWEDNIRLDKEITIKDARKHGRHWTTFAELARCLDAMFGEDFLTATGNFRNAHNHQFPPNVLIGYTNSVRRLEKLKDGKWRYAIGGEPPLSLEAVADALEKEGHLARETFTAFQGLVREQVAAHHAAYQ